MREKGRFILHYLVLVLFLAVVLALPHVTFAKDYYVDPSGNDGNDGQSTGTAWQSLVKVSGATFQPGDTINFKKGGVWVGELLAKSSGNSSARITYQAYGSGNAPQIKNLGAASSNYEKVIRVTGSYNVIQGFLLTDAHEAGVRIMPGANNNVIQNNEMTRVGTGVMTEGDTVLITQNYAHDLTAVRDSQGGNDDYGAVCFWMYGGNNIEISYNRCINGSTHSYDYGHDGGFVEIFNNYQSMSNIRIHHNYSYNTEGYYEFGAGNSGASASDITISYNTIVSPGSSTNVCINASNGNINISNIRFENNTVVKNGNTDGKQGYEFFGCRDDLSAFQVRNNIFYFTEGSYVTRHPNLSHSNNLYYMTGGSQVGYSLGSSEKEGDPKFMNLGGNDFHLQSGSPAIDGGASLGYTTDFENKNVPSGSAPDMGAFEYGASGGTGNGTTGGTTSGGTTTGGTTGGGSCTLSLFTSSSAIPSGFASPFDVVGQGGNMMNASCSAGGTISLSLGNGSQSTYVYKLGYVYRNGTWQQLAFTGSNIQASNWYPANASGSVVLTSAELAQGTYIVSYQCSWTGSVWKCGCLTNACDANASPKTGGMWQLQFIKQ